MSDLETALTAALTATTDAAARCLVFGGDKQRIREATTELRRLLAIWDEHHKAVSDTIRTLLTAACKQCDHAGAKRGYNDRDGSWMNPCPACGHSE